ncbi:MAG TPA: hypothetical protein VFA86_13760 [Gammaproteobacteria bacterium]|nr:hypothetical protein [Gammaproteobacteria bacterium]
MLSHRMIAAAAASRGPQVLFNDDYEAANLSSYVGHTSVLSISQATPEQGANSLAVGGDATNYVWGAYLNPKPYTAGLTWSGYMRFTDSGGSVRAGVFAGDPALSVNIASIGGYGFIFAVNSGYNSSLGTVSIYRLDGTNLANASPAVSYNTWYAFSLTVKNGVVTLDLAGAHLTANDTTYTSFQAWGGYSYRNYMLDEILVKAA